ncbi:3'-5' exonuclease [Methylomonas koyamae]|uniref:3'-5' exonuclease n=1 Tax=Methylomonas koyamae TaxID=702114 RepID=UPI0011290A93|nr:3'-5' exonuclease [Methylomonas koyamae]TPQ24908.1 3'-5' exoribonuclease [Methylomonas koyamae]
MPMQDLMIDLETLSTQPNAAIVSIGACMFDLTTGEIGAEYYQAISINDHPGLGHISAETVAWWMRQPYDARLVFQDKNARGITDALMELTTFRQRHRAQTYWSNGASFDLVILRQAHQKNGFAGAIWNYWQERDTRTMVDVAKRMTGEDVTKTTPFEGEKHNALADAKHQARYISKAYRLLAGGAVNAVLP